MNIDENIFRMPIYPMLNHMNIDELNISFNVKPRPLRSRSSHALLTYSLAQSLGGACCSIVRHKVAPGIRAPYSLYVAVSMFINHGGIEQVKLWCEVRSVRVVFAAKYISSCVCASTFEITRSM